MLWQCWPGKPSVEGCTCHNAVVNTCLWSLPFLLLGTKVLCALTLQSTFGPPWRLPWCLVCSFSRSLFRVSCTCMLVFLCVHLCPFVHLGGFLRGFARSAFRLTLGLSFSVLSLYLLRHCSLPWSSSLSLMSLVYVFWTHLSFKLCDSAFCFTLLCVCASAALF